MRESSSLEEKSAEIVAKNGEISRLMRRLTVEDDAESREGAEVAETLGTTSSYPRVLPMSLPKLREFSGDRSDDGESLEQCVLEFERHAELTGWVGDIKHLQLEVHLTGRALKVYDGLPAENRLGYDSLDEADAASSAGVLQTFAV